MEEPKGRVYSCSTCHTRHAKPTGKKCAVKSAKPATGQELSDFMAEMRFLIAGTNQRVDSLEKQIDQSHGESRAANTGVDNVVPHQNNGILGEFVSPVNLPDSRDMLNASTVLSSNSAQRNNNASPTRNAEALKARKSSVQLDNFVEDDKMVYQSDYVLDGNDINRCTKQHAASSGNPITVEALKNNAEVVNRAAQRIHELNLQEYDLPDASRIGTGNINRGKKSGSISKASDKVIKDLDWPHYHITRGINLTPSSYEELSVEEFILGYIRMLRDTDSTFDKDVMLEILEDLMEDVIDFSWGNAKGFYKSIGLEIERGKFAWDDSATIQKKRFTQCRVQKAVEKQEVKPKKQIQVPANAVCCPQYQLGLCDKKFDHLPHIHACAFCFTNRNLVHKHKESDCFFKPKVNSKN